MSFDPIVFNTISKIKYPIGSIVAGYPNGSTWVPANGQKLAKADYPALYDIYTKSYNGYKLDTTLYDTLYSGATPVGYPRMLTYNSTRLRGKMVHNSALMWSNQTSAANIDAGGTNTKYDSAYGAVLGFFGVDEADPSVGYGSLHWSLGLKNGIVVTSGLVLDSSNAPSQSMANLIGDSSTTPNLQWYPFEPIYDNSSSERYHVFGNALYQYNITLTSPSSYTAYGTNNTISITSFNKNFSNPKLITTNSNSGNVGRLASEHGLKCRFTAFNGGLLAYKNDGTSTSAGVNAFWSTDSGVTWSTKAMTGTVPTSYMAIIPIQPNTANQKVLMVSSGSDNKLYVSNDGLTGYTATATFNATNLVINKFKLVNNVLFFWSSGAPTKVYYTADKGNSFSSFTVPDSRQIVDIGFVNGLYLLITDRIGGTLVDLTKISGYYTSANLIGWTYRDFAGIYSFFDSLETQTPNAIANAADGSSLCIMPHYLGNSYLLRTTDGINWTMVKYSDSRRNVKLGFKLGIFYVGTQYFILEYSMSNGFSNNFSTTNNLIYTSADGNFWGVEHQCDFLSYVTSNAPYSFISISQKANTFYRKSTSLKVGVGTGSNYSNKVCSIQHDRDTNGRRLGVIPASGAFGNSTDGNLPYAIATTATLGGVDYVFKDDVLYSVVYDSTNDDVLFTPILGFGLDYGLGGFHIKQLKDYILFAPSSNFNQNVSGGLLYYDGTTLKTISDAATKRVTKAEVIGTTNEIFCVRYGNEKLISYRIDAGSPTIVGESNPVISGIDNSFTSHDKVTFTYTNGKYALFGANGKVSNCATIDGNWSVPVSYTIGNTVFTYPPDVISLGSSCIIAQDNNRFYFNTSSVGSTSDFNERLNSGLLSANMALGYGESTPNIGFTTAIKPALSRSEHIKYCQNGDVYYSNGNGLFYIPFKADIDISDIKFNNKFNESSNGMYAMTYDANSKAAGALNTYRFFVANPIPNMGGNSGKMFIPLNNSLQISTNDDSLRSFKNCGFVVGDSSFNGVFYGLDRLNVNGATVDSSTSLSSGSHGISTYAGNLQFYQFTTGSTYNLVKYWSPYKMEVLPLKSYSSLNTEYNGTTFVGGRMISYLSANAAQVYPYQMMENDHRGTKSYIPAIVGTVTPVGNQNSGAYVTYNLRSAPVIAKRGMIYAKRIENTTCVMLSPDGLDWKVVYKENNSNPITIHQSCNSDDIIISISTNDSLDTVNSSFGITGFLHSADGGLNWSTIQFQSTYLPSLTNSMTVNSVLNTDINMPSTHLYKDQANNELVFMWCGTGTNQINIKLYKDASFFTVPSVSGSMIKAK